MFHIGQLKSIEKPCLKTYLPSAEKENYIQLMVMFVVFSFLSLFL